MASLTRDEARTRAGLLSVERYDLEVDLTGLLDGDRLAVRSSISFSAGEAASTFADIVAEHAEAWLDGVRLDDDAFDGERLRLDLEVGAHRLVVESGTTRTGQRDGIHRSVDPGDGEAYVWTSFEPDDARRVFACFDQPDLKAVAAVTVRAPAGWTVASNSRPASTSDPDAGARNWVFADTPKLSTYLVVVCAGPFHELRRNVDGYDLGLLARRSLAGYLDEQADELFGLTAAGLRFFGEKFAMPFPQAGYTQVFCPDFQGAMENWGCVTWMDSFVFRNPPTAAERELRAIILLHEMAHMWFGDIVTMQWWDDLWLNESFADWAAVWATASATEFTGAWASFLASRKESGYIADRSPATHPIRQDVPTVEAAKAAFDMVTYAKGASVLRQLTAYAGEERFVAGLGGHFEKHAFGNATLADLLATVGASSGRELDGWAKDWLLTAGTDTISLLVGVEAAADGNPQYTGVEVLLEAPEQHPARRPHRLAIGVYDVKPTGDGRGDGGGMTGGVTVLRERIELDVEGPATPVPGLAGQPVADLLLLNDGDLTFARVRPDAAQIEALQRYGPFLPDPVSRALVRLTLWHLVDDGLLAATDVVRYVVRALAVETESSVREGLLRTAVAAVQDWSDPEGALAAGDELAIACIDLAERSAGSGQAGDAATWLSALQSALGVAYRPDTLARLEALTSADVDLRWRWLARSAAAGGYDQAAVDEVVARDPDPDASARVATVRAARPDAVSKAETWQAVFVDRTVPLQAFGPIGRAFWDPAHAQVLRPFADAFVEELPRLGESGMTATMTTLANLFPRHGVDAAFCDRIVAAVTSDDVSPLVKGQVAERAATLRRMLAARALAPREPERA